MKKYTILIIGYFLTVSMVSACSLTQDADRFKSMTENFDSSKYSHVFLGEVTEVVNQGPGGSNGGEPKYKITIHETYRGDKAGEVELGSAAHSCGSFYSEGVIMVWFLDNEGEYVDELHPQYSFNNLTQAQKAVQQALSTTNIQEASWGVSTNEVVTSPFTIKGTTPGEPWIAFEGQVGVARLITSGGKTIDTQPMQVVNDDWMHTPPHNFSLTFEFEQPQVPTGKIVFESEVPSGQSETQIVEFPVVFTPDALPTVNGPTSEPGEDFSGPTTPPPYEEETPEDQDTGNWLQKIIDWISGLFR